MFNPAPRSYVTPGGVRSAFYTELSALPHLLIAGATGAGKSVALNGIIHNLISFRSPYSCKFILIDPKKVELIDYAPLPHTVCYASEPADMIVALNLALEETDRRFSSMQRDGVKEFNGPDLYVIIDELADLMTSQKKSALPPLQRLAQIGRAARVHVIACTQNVLAVTIPTTLKCNFPAVLGLRTASRAQSRYLIDSEGCESLPDPKKAGHGYGFFRNGADLTRHELHMYSDSDIRSVVSWWRSSACIAS